VSNQILNESAEKRITTSAITARDLSKRFNREWIFRNFNYQFATGNTYAITGPNGSGKSTLLQVLWGQVPQTSGILQHKIDAAELPADKICEFVSIATPYMDLIDEFTLTEQLEFHFKLKKMRGGLKTNDLLEIMYLTASKDKYIGNFSSGMKQRTKLALALYTEAAFVFLDEPGTNLDDQAFEWYKKELQKLPEGCATLIASNDPAEYPGSATVINLLTFKV
jgi:ABC-type multidrug transport system ATPase subunit